MTTATEAVLVSAARARWRSDLLKYDAAEHTRIAGSDQSAVAQNLLAAATAKEAEATIHLDLAEAQVRHSIAKQERDADPKDAGAQERYAAAAQALQYLRSFWRGIDEMLGTARAVRTVDHFPEPTDEEVLATHGEVS